MSYQSLTDINKQTYLSYTSHNPTAAEALGIVPFLTFLRQTDLPYFCIFIPGQLFLSICPLENEENNRDFFIINIILFYYIFFFYL